MYVKNCRIDINSHYPDFLLIPIGFYIVVAIGGFDLGILRHDGWLFDVGDAHEPWWKIYTYWNLRKVQYSALLQTMPTQFALLFFNIRKWSSL